MAKYFVYFSATGNGDFLASLYETKGYQPVKVETIKPLGKINFFKSSYAIKGFNIAITS